MENSVLRKVQHIECGGTGFDNIVDRKNKLEVEQKLKELQELLDCLCKQRNDFTLGKNEIPVIHKNLDCLLRQLALIDLL
jgi:hypothetical protein